MAKRAPIRQSQHSRKQISRHAREARAKKALIAGTATVLGVVVLLLGWALYDQYVLRPRKPVAMVSGVPIRLDTYQKLVNYRRMEYQNYLGRLESQRQELSVAGEDQAFLLQYVDQQIQQAESDLQSLPLTALDQLIDELIVRQECDQRGITVSSDEVQLEMEQQFGYDRNPPTPTPVTATLPITVTPAPTATPMTHDRFVELSGSWFEAAQQSGGFSEQDFRRLLETSLYRQKLEDALRAEVPSTTEQVHARHILLETEEEAQAVLTRLEAGEDFEMLAAELSADESTKQMGGDLGWFPRGIMIPEFEEAAFALQPGESSGIVESQFGFHIIRVDEHDPSLEIAPEMLARVQGEAVRVWFEARGTSDDIVKLWNSSMIPTPPAAASR